MNFRKIKALLILLFFALLLVSCEQESNDDIQNNDGSTQSGTNDGDINNENENNHLHQYSNTFEYDNDYHWHNATCEHNTLKSNYEAHKFGQWQTTIEATTEAVGSKKKVCNDCGYEVVEEIPIHEHGYETTMKYDYKYHWYASTCGCDDLKKDLYLHVIYENECIKCGYKGTALDPTVDEVTYKYDLDLGGYVVTAISGNDKGEIHIPSAFNGEEVRGIDLIGSPDANSIYIPSTIQYIDPSSFSLSDKLVEVYNLSSLSVSSYFPNLKAIHTSTDEESSIVRLESGFEFVKDDNDEYYLYEYSGDCAEVVLPENINGFEYEILQTAFSYNQKLTSFTATKGVKKFNYGIFEMCNNLKELVLPYLGETIDKPKQLSYLFAGGSLVKLTKLTILEGDICDNATQLMNTNYLMELNFGSNVKSIGKNAFEYSYNLISLVLPKNLKVLSSNAFLGCYSLVEVYNLSEVDLDSTNTGCPSYYAKVVHTSLDSESVLCYEGDFVFYRENENSYYLVQYRGNATDVTLPQSINDKSYIISSNTFNSISTIKTLDLGDGVVEIEQEAFDSCNIESIKLGNGITEIVDKTFYRCLKLEDIILGDNITYISSEFAYNCDDITYNVSEDICYLGTEDNDYYYMVYAKYPTSKEFILHDDTVYINESAFSNCTNLKTIVIPNNVLEIKDFTFKNCTSLESVIFGEKVTTIGNSAFKGCTGLKYLVVKSNQLEIKENAFEQATQLSEIYYIYTENTIDVDSIGNAPFNSASKYYYSLEEPTTEGNYWYYNDENVITKWEDEATEN